MALSSRDSDRINSVLLRSSDRGGGGYKHAVGCVAVEARCAAVTQRPVARYAKVAGRHAARYVTVAQRTAAGCLLGTCRHAFISF